MSWLIPNSFFPSGINSFPGVSSIAASIPGIQNAVAPAPALGPSTTVYQQAAPQPRQQSVLTGGWGSGPLGQHYGPAPIAPTTQPPWTAPPDRAPGLGVNPPAGIQFNTPPATVPGLGPGTTTYQQAPSAPSTASFTMRPPIAPVMPTTTPSLFSAPQSNGTTTWNRNPTPSGWSGGTAPTWRR